PPDATHRPRSLRLLGHASRWNTASASIAPSESNQCRQTHSLTSPWESPRFNATETCSSFKTGSGLPEFLRRNFPRSIGRPTHDGCNATAVFEHNAFRGVAEGVHP